VEKAMQDKKSTIIRAQGEAKSAKLIGDAVRDNPGFIELRKLEAARDIASTVSNSNNRVFLDSHSLMLNVQDKSKVDLGKKMAELAAPEAAPPAPEAAPAVMVSTASP
jgi:prohibitin 2